MSPYANSVRVRQDFLTAMGLLIAVLFLLIDACPADAFQPRHHQQRQQRQDKNHGGWYFEALKEYNNTTFRQNHGRNPINRDEVRAHESVPHVDYVQPRRGHTGATVEFWNGHMWVNRY